MPDRDPYAVAAIGRRLQLFLQHQGLNQTQATELLGTSATVLGNLAAGANVAGKTITRVAQAFPELNLDWWLWGTGAMKAETQNPSTAATRANDLRSSALSLQSEPRGKTSKAQAAQAQKWAEVFDRALLERLDLMHAVVEHQDRVIELLTHEIKNP